MRQGIGVILNRLCSRGVFSDVGLHLSGVPIVFREPLAPRNFTKDTKTSANAISIPRALAKTSRSYEGPIQTITLASNWTQAPRATTCTTSPPHPTLTTSCLLYFSFPEGVRIRAMLLMRSITAPAPNRWVRAPLLRSIVVPAPRWWVLAPHSCAALRFQRHVGGFQRPLICSLSAPAPDWWAPAPHSSAALRFQRRRNGGFQRPTPVQHCRSSAAVVCSSAPLLRSIAVPAPLCWPPDPHSCAQLRLQRRNGGFQRTTPAQHCGFSTALVCSSAPLLCSHCNSCVELVSHIQGSSTFGESDFVHKDAMLG